MHEFIHLHGDVYVVAVPDGVLIPEELRELKELDKRMLDLQLSGGSAHLVSELLGHLGAKHRCLRAHISSTYPQYAELMLYYMTIIDGQWFFTVDRSNVGKSIEMAFMAEKFIRDFM